MIDRFTPAPSQASQLTPEQLEAFSQITLARLQDIEASEDIPDFSSMSESEIEAWLQQYRATAETEMRRELEQLLDGDSTIADIENVILETVATGVIVVFLASVGGTLGLQTQQSPVVLVRQLSANIRSAARATARNAQRIIAGELTPNQILAIAGRRALAFQADWHQFQMFDAIANRGHNEAYRVLGVANHCPDCVAYEQPQWTAINNVVPVATSCVCQAQCHCRVFTRFNPQRALEELSSGSLIDRVQGYQQALAGFENDFFLDTGGYNYRHVLL